MSKEMNFEKLVSVIEEELGVEASIITPESSLKEDLDADSIDLFELIIKIEEEFEIKIKEEDYPKLVTVQNLMDYIEDNK